MRDRADGLDDLDLVRSVLAHGGPHRPEVAGGRRGAICQSPVNHPRRGGEEVAEVEEVAVALLVSLVLPWLREFCEFCGCAHCVYKIRGCAHGGSGCSRP